MSHSWPAFVNYSEFEDFLKSTGVGQGVRLAQILGQYPTEDSARNKLSVARKDPLWPTSSKAKSKHLSLEEVIVLVHVTPNGTHKSRRHPVLNPAGELKSYMCNALKALTLCKTVQDQAQVLKGLCKLKGHTTAPQFLWAFAGLARLRG